MLGTAGDSQMVGIVSPAMQALRVHQTRSCRALDPASETELFASPAYPSTNTFELPRLGRSHWRALAQGFVLGPSTTTPFAYQPVSCEPSNLTQCPPSLRYRPAVD